MEGHLIDGSGACTVIAIRDRKRHGWVLYPHGVAGLGVLIADDAARLLADRIQRPARTPSPAGPDGIVHAHPRFRRV